MAEFINTIDVIGDDALTNSVIDGTVTEFKADYVNKIRNYAFQNCLVLTTADFPAVTNVGDNAFMNCSALTTAVFPSATHIGTNAFFTCGALTTVDFPLAKTLGGYTFMNCTALTSANFPAVTYVTTNSFKNCSKLTTADFPAATGIGNDAFQDCSKLTTANFPMLRGMDNNVFRYCKALTTADFPAVTSIGQYVFGDCSKLTTLILRNTENVATLSNKNVFTSTPINSGKGYIYVPRALVDSYKSATNWSTYAAQIRALEDWTIDGTVTGELDAANRRMVRFFNEDGTLLGYKVVTVGSDVAWDGETPTKPGVDNPDDYAFTGWSPAPTNVTEDMDCYAGFKCTLVFWSKIVDRSISGNYTNNRVENIGNQAFSNCTYLTGVDFPSATSIGGYAFYGCKALTTVDFPVVTSIGDYAFYGCSKLTALILRNTTTVATLSNANAFASTPIKSGTGYIYVPRDLVERYKSATNWSTYAAQIRAIEDYPEICGGDA